VYGAIKTPNIIADAVIKISFFIFKLSILASRAESSEAIVLLSIPLTDEQLEIDITSNKESNDFFIFKDSVVLLLQRLKK
jgi:hypothetical protein